MSYLIYKANGTAVTIPDNAIDSAYYSSGGGGGFGPGNVPQVGHGLGTQLLGRNTVDYGAAVAQNLLQLTENFCSSVVPSDAISLQGQIWFNQSSNTAGSLYVKSSSANTGGIANWEQVVTLASSGTSTINGNLVVSGTVTAAGFLGNATTATTANFSEYTLITASASNTAYPLVMAPTDATGQQSLLVDSTAAITWNPSAGVLATPGTIEATTFVGALTGHASADVALSGSTMTGPLILNGDPTTTMGAATKQYVDQISAGVNVHDACETSTTASSNLSSNLYIAGVAGGSPDAGTGVGATLRATANVVLGTVGGYSGLAVGARVLVKDQADNKQNGIYVVTSLGSAGLSPWILTRAHDYDNSTYGQVKAGDVTYIQEGTNGGAQWIQTSPGSQSPGDCTKIGTDPIIFSQFASAVSGPVPVINPTGTPKDGDMQVLYSPVRVNIYANGLWNQVFPAVYS